MTQPPLVNSDQHQEDPDIVRVIIDRVSALVPEDQRQQLTDVEAQVRIQYGGLRVRILKRKKYMTPQQRQEISNRAMQDTTSSNKQLIQEAGISRRHWYEIIKKRGG